MSGIAETGIGRRDHADAALGRHSGRLKCLSMINLRSPFYRELITLWIRGDKICGDQFVHCFRGRHRIVHPDVQFTAISGMHKVQVYGVAHNLRFILERGS
jgi:hypothetical protein